MAVFDRSEIRDLLRLSECAISSRNRCCGRISDSLRSSRGTAHPNSISQHTALIRLDPLLVA
ncbi:hypothetical protein BN903_105 [Halorubrum sp. AJ67]|nr:hypothetical protein BN903_105 [Halorubrum sp. AJ67]